MRRYTLTARGSNPISFDQTQDLQYVHKGYSVFIQTDKAVYRPGNSVKFRAIVVTPQQLKPSVVGSIDVEITDAKGNLIQRWDRVFTTKGVFAAELDIAEAPVMGDWNITVDVSGQLFTKSFLVISSKFFNFYFFSKFLNSAKPRDISGGRICIAKVRC